MTGAPITRYIYGQFIEHLGDTVNKGLWAEMLDDRKFFGPDQFVAMDRLHPCVGDQTPVVKLDATAARGILQAGLPLLEGGNPGVEVKSSPVEGAPKRATVPAVSIGIYELEAQ
jgi:alpha-N-arabinofuranosidase